MNLEVYLSELEYLVNIDSGSDDIDGLNKMADFFSEKFAGLGWKVKNFDFAPNGGRCVICTNRDAEHYDLMLIGHLDTVFPRGTSEKRPFRIEGNVAYGPGVCDMKHGCLLMYHLMKELPSEINDKLNIVVVFNPDEEIGSHKSKAVYEDYARRSEYAYIYEASSTIGARCVKRKGACGLSADFYGKAGHCGSVFANGAKSAVSEMARWIVALDALQSREKGTMVNVGVANGGTKRNIVADRATIKTSIRYSDPTEVERVNAVIEKLLAESEEHGIRVEVSRSSKLPLVPSEKAEKYIKHLEELTRAHGFDYSFDERGGLSDANIIAQFGAICIDGMGPSGTKAHCDEEYMLIDSVIPSFDYSNLLIKDLADNKN